jgi:hypothetical protein
VAKDGTDAKARKAADVKPADVKPAQTSDAASSVPQEAKPESAAAPKADVADRKIPVVTAPREAMTEARVAQKRKAI